MKKRRKNLIKCFIALCCVIVFITIYFIVFKINIDIIDTKKVQAINIIKINNSSENYKDSIKHNNGVSIKTKSGKIIEFKNKSMKFGKNSKKDQEIYQVNSIINNYALIDIYYCSGFNTIFVGLDNGEIIDNIPPCKNIDKNNFNKDKNMFFCANYDSKKHEESGISVFVFINGKMHMIYDEEEYLNYTNVNWINENELKITYKQKNKIRSYKLICNENTCEKIN